MNYELHYNKLIERAKNRVLETYKERHHIVPRCMDGGDNKENLVDLTAREHFIAHILLVKMYPKEYGLIKAVNMMCMVSNGQEERKIHNKMYGWLREKFSEAQSINQSGEGNSQFGTVWIVNYELETSIKIKKSDLEKYIDLGWEKGRNYFSPVVIRSPKIKKYFYFIQKLNKFYKRRTKKVKLEKKKQIKLEKKREEFEKEGHLYNELFLLYLRGEYTSIRDFVYNKNMYNKSHVTLTKKFIIHVSNYKEIVKPHTGKISA